MPAKKDVETYRRKLHEMLPQLKEEYNVSYIGLFGSYVRGENTRKAILMCWWSSAGLLLFFVL